MDDPAPDENENESATSNTDDHDEPAPLASRRGVLTAFSTAGLLGALPIYSGTASACSCIPPGPPEEELNESDAVFAGSVTTIEDRSSGGIVSSSRPLYVTFDVTETWKGPSNTMLTVITAASSASCGYPFQEGQKYLVYAYSRNDDLHVSLCSRTAPLSEAQQDLNALGPGTSPTDQPEPIDQDCLSFDPTDLSIRPDSSNRWLLTDGRSRMKVFENLTEAIRALTTIRYYGMNSHCFVGRPNASLEYWLVDGHAPTGSMAGEDCVSFDPSNLTVESRGGQWLLLDGNHSLFAFPNENEAEQARSIIRHHGFTKSCFVGRPDPSMTYLRK